MQANKNTITLVIEAYALSDFGDGPQWAVAEVDMAFVERVERLAALVRVNDLAFVTANDSVDWDQEDDLVIRTDGLVVVADGDFWFTGYLKHASYKVETRLCNIADLRKALEAGPEAEIEGVDSMKWAGGILFSAYGQKEVDDLAHNYAESLGLEDEPEEEAEA
jgi:hypothetical protein